MIINISGGKGAGKTTTALKIAKAGKKIGFRPIILSFDGNRTYPSLNLEKVDDLKVNLGWKHFELKKEFKSNLEEYKEKREIAFINSNVDKSSQQEFITQFLEINEQEETFNLIILDNIDIEIEVDHNVVVSDFNFRNIEIAEGDIVIFNKQKDGIVYKPVENKVIFQKFECEITNQINFEKLDIDKWNNQKYFFLEANTNTGNIFKRVKEMISKKVTR